MKNHIFINLCIILIASFASAKSVSPKSRTVPGSPLSESALMQELTGQKTSSPVATNPKNAPLPVQHFLAGQKAANERNYILAIKHFNTVLKKYPRSQQVKPALVAKAKVYKEMGLNVQAEHNLKMARQNTIQINTSQKTAARATAQAVKTNERTKSVK